MKTRNGLIITICALLFGALSIFSCDTPLSLGTRLNMDPPAVNIEKPDFMENIKGSLSIAGTAYDNEEVAILSVTVERVSESGQDWKQELQSDRGEWQIKSGDGLWESDKADGTWKIQKNKENARVDWSINVLMGDAPNGEYLITVEAENNVKTKGALQQRRVVIDNYPPVVTILAPFLDFDDINTNETFTFADDVKPAFDAYQLEDTAVLDKLHNKKIKIQYKIEDDFSIDKLIFQLADQESNIYYNRNGQPSENISWSGSVEILANDIIDPADGHVISYGEKKYLQVISRASDKAGNIKTRSHGWLVYWPDADKPWAAGVGHESIPQEFIVFPGSDVQGQAYDNDGVKSVAYAIYNKGSGELLKKDSLINEPLIEGDPPTMFFSWKFTAPEDSDEYKIIIDCIDMYGVSGDTKTRYFYVESTSVPGVTIENPNAAESLFGDKYGDFIIKGIAGDGSQTGPVSLKMVWLNPKGDDESRFNYQSNEYNGWVTGGTSYTDSKGNIYRQDAQGNKIWDLTLGDAVFDAVTKRRNRPFSKGLNLFDAKDLNIGVGALQNSLTSQTFIFLLTGGTGIKVTKSHSFRGDISPPSLTIDSIFVDFADGGKTDKTYTIAELLQPNKSIDVLSHGDKITLNGTWGDDSFDVWKDISRMRELKALWNNYIVPVPVLTDTGVWSAGPLTLTPEEAANGAVTITASLGDAGNNITEKTVSVRVDTNTPYLMLITSDNDNGYYKQGDKINIYLEFNRAVSYSSGSPSLSLNTNGTAVYQSGTSTDIKQHFIYTVGVGHNTAKLNVTGIEGGGDYIGAGGTANTINSLTSRNLKDTKSITIDTTAPTITSVQSLSGLSGNNYYKQDAVIYLLVTFNENILFDEGTASGNSGTRLTLNSNFNSSGSVSGAVYAVNPAASGNNAILFTYTVASGQNTPFTPPNNYTSPLTASAITLGTASKITDLAGNPWSAWGSPTNISPAKNIYIDTTQPGSPTVNVTEGTFTTPQTFTVTGGESGASLEYSLTGNTGPWLTYTSTVTISSTTTYKISARQTDQAKNVSSPSAEKTVKIETGSPLLISLGGTPGTYKSGSTIDIKLNLRDAVNVTGTPRLALGGTGSFTTSPAYANYYSGTGSKTLVFRYTVQSNDNVDPLKIESINLNGATLARVGDSVNLTTEFGNSLSTLSNNLDFYAPIKIDNSPMTFISGSISGTNLTLTFSKTVYKGTGNISISYNDVTYLAPTVISKAEFIRWGGIAGSESTSNIGYYYEEGINGTSSTGTTDTAEKYILKYDFDHGNTALVGILETQNAYNVTVPVVSSSVTATGSSLTVDLSSTYALPVKGVSYAITFDKGIVKDSLGNEVAAYTGTGTTITNPGVNQPFIRVQKNRGTITDGTPYPVTVPGTPQYSNYWVKNAEIQISNNQPAGNWAEVDTFTIYLGWGENIDKTGIVVTDPNSALYIARTAVKDVQGNFFTNNSNNNFAMNWWLDTNSWTQTNNYWVNPYSREIIQGGRWQDGDFTTNERNVWVNLSTPGIQTTKNDSNPGSQPAGVGWLRVTETVMVGGGTYTVKTIDSTQPLTAQVRIDTQTPGATIRYTYNTTTTTPVEGTGTPFNGSTKPEAPTVTMPTTSANNGTSASSTATFTLGNTANTTNGYLYGIRADATKTVSGSTATSSASYDKVSRSVIIFDNIQDAKNWDILKNLANTAERDLNLWIRGGDGLSGSNATPGFPLSWSDTDYKGARLMTGPANGVKYWVSWEVTVKAYFHFVAGSTSTAAEAGNGPHQWSWAKNKWAFQHDKFPLNPGGSLWFIRDTLVVDPATENFEFFDTFSGSR